MHTFKIHMMKKVWKKRMQIPVIFCRADCFEEGSSWQSIIFGSSGGGGGEYCRAPRHLTFSRQEAYISVFGAGWATNSGALRLTHECVSNTKQIIKEEVRERHFKKVAHSMHVSEVLPFHTYTVHFCVCGFSYRYMSIFAQSLEV